MTKQIWNELSKINANEYKEKKDTVEQCKQLEITSVLGSYENKS